MRHLVRLAAIPAMLACATVSRAGYERASWGGRMDDVRRLYPGGKTMTLSGGEAAYRVVLRAFDAAPAIATFAFHPEHRLNVVVFEFPDGSSRVAEGDYPRPSQEQALGIRAKLERALQTKYGDPTHEVSGVAGSSVKVWRGREDLVRMQRVAVADGKEDLRLWVEDGREAITPTEGQKVLELAACRTDPARWSGAGALGVRWGMGVGDVLERFPALTPISFAESHFDSYRVDARLEGPVGVQLDFFGGMLCAMSVSLSAHSDVHLERKTDEQREAFEADVERWRGRVLELLAEEYGDPVVAPSREDLAAAMKRRGASEVAWQWRAKDTVVTLTVRSARVQVLSYQDVGDLGRAAYEAAVAHQAQEELKRKPRL